MSGLTHRMSTTAATWNGWRVQAAALGICAALTGAAWFIGIQPAFARREAAAADTAELDARHQAAKKLADGLAVTRRQLTDTNRQVMALPLRLEPAAAVNRRLSQLADLAGDTGLAVDEVQPGAPVDGPYYQTVSIRMSGAGTYPACATFLHQLRSRFPDTAVRSFECTNPTPADDHPVATYRVELTWYTVPAGTSRK